MNFIARNRKKLEEKNYVRKAPPESNYFFDISVNKLKDFKSRYGTQFNIILFGKENLDGDYYVIPFNLIENRFVEESITKDRRNRPPRWTGKINAHHLKIDNIDGEIDISNYYGVIIDDKGDKIHLSEDESNDYSINNRKIEINTRQKQSQFREKVLKNFNNKCCISGIDIPDLLIASHIIPWSNRIDTRLDPSNGLCLFTLFDQLFDKGYISFTNDFKVIISTKINSENSILHSIFNSIKGKVIREPSRHKIKIEYIEYHRNNILIK